MGRLIAQGLQRNKVAGGTSELPAVHNLPMAEADARIFLSVADTGSFTAAALLHEVSPSAVSKAVSRLEAALGVQLLVRSTRAIHLTDAGAVFRDRCGPAFRLLAEAAEEAIAGAGSLRGTVRLGVPSLFGTYLIAPGLPGLLAANPELQIEIITTMRPSDIIDRGLDLCIVVGPLADSGFSARPMGYGQFVTVASPEYLGVTDMPQVHADLERHRCLGWLRPDGRVQSWLFRVGEDEISFEPPVSVTSDDMHHLAAMAVAGTGICHLPLFAVAECLKAGRLVTLLEGFAPAPKLASFVFPSGREMPRRARVVMEHLIRATAFVPGTSRYET